MATTRYFKATDGERTYFRASPTQVYLSLSVGENVGDFGWQLHRHARGRFPAVEITRQEYVALTALKVARAERLLAAWEAKHGRKWNGSAAMFLNAPRESWVENTALPVEA